MKFLHISTPQRYNLFSILPNFVVTFWLNAKKHKQLRVGAAVCVYE